MSNTIGKTKVSLTIDDRQVMDVEVEVSKAGATVWLNGQKMTLAVFMDKYEKESPELCMAIQTSANALKIAVGEVNG